MGAIKNDQQDKRDKRRKPVKPSFPSDDRKTFVNIRVDKDRRDEFTGYLETASMDDDLDMLLQADIKLSLKWDVNNDCYVVLAFCMDETDPNSPYILTARGSTAARTLALLCWGHVHWCEGEWAKFATTQLELFA